MAQYYNEQAWGPARQASWEQPQPPSRSGASSTVNRDEAMAFSAQFEEVDRAIENLAKSGRGFFPAPGRRDSMPVMGPPRPYPDYGMVDPRMGGPQRHHSVSEYDGSRSHSASNVQGYYQSQRYAPRPNDMDQMAQAKRRMAAQRERELRNYHQEQQYQRNVSGSKSDRSMSPSALNEEGRRELIARQHRALYGEGSALYSNNNPTSSQDARVAPSVAGRGPSPLAFDPFGMQASRTSGDSAAVQMPPRDGKDSAGGAQEARANSNASPSSSQNPTFSLFENAQQANRTSNASAGGSSPPHQTGQSSNGQGVAPIGTRPAVNQGQSAGGPMGSRRSTTPLPSPLSYSYNASEQNNNSSNNNHNNSANNDRSASGSAHPSNADKGVGLGWGNNSSNVWGPAKNTLGVQASVWG